jgi:hypothetical protein
MSNRSPAHRIGASVAREVRVPKVDMILPCGAFECWRGPGP